VKPDLKESTTLSIPLVDIDAHTEELRKLAEDADYFFLDGQHGCFATERLPAFCAAAGGMGVPVLFRLRHPREAYLAGWALDHGPAGIIVPQVETREQVRDAVEAFYYPPVGKRGWGPKHGYGRMPDMTQREYADWWNAHGVLAIQLESVQAVRNVRSLVEAGQGGVQVVMFGPADLALDIEACQDPEFRDRESCYAFTLAALKGLNVIVIPAMPFGTVHLQRP